MYKSTFIAIALAASSPVLAQSPTPAPAVAVDPVKLALGQQIAGSLWPDGTYSRMVQQMLGGQMMDAMLDMKLPDMVSEEAIKGAGKDGKAFADAKPSMRETMKAKDPHFEERMRLTMKAMGDAMSELFAPMEPKMRAGLAKAYARRFTEPQLNDIVSFFATSSGKTYARESMTLFMDKELMTEMMSAMPEIMKSMPKVLEKVKAATDHLPPVPTSEKHVEMQEVIDKPTS
jgi:hypothetical protein